MPSSLRLHAPSSLLVALAFSAGACGLADEKGQAGTSAGGSSCGIACSVAGSGTGPGSGGGGEPAGSGGAAPSAGAAVGGAGGTGVAGSGGGGGSPTTAGAAGAATADFCAARSGLVFCDGFETQAAGAAQAKSPWAPSINGDGTLEIDETLAHSGKHSLKVHGSGFSTFLVLSLDALPATLATPPAPLHVRAYVHLAEAMTGGHNTFVVGDLESAPGAGNAFRLGEMNAMLMYTVSGDTHGALANDNYYTDHLPGAALTAAHWGCLELVLAHDETELSVSLDGQDIPDLHHTDFPVDAYDTLRFGFEKYAGPVSDVWYDDIAVGSAPIGCQ